MNREERRKAAREQGIPLDQLGKRVGRRLPGVNIGTPEARFAGGVPLSEQVEEVVRQVEAQREPTLDQVHLPAIAPLFTEGQWGVFCTGCSAVAREYVYPCEKWLESPPQVLVAHDPSPSEV